MTGQYLIIKFTDQTSISLLDIREDNPERYQTLLPLDKALRKSEILKGISELRSFATKFDKFFDTKKDRKSIIPALIKLLVNLPKDELEITLKEIYQNNSPSLREEEGYLGLAKSIMGKS